MKNLYLVVFAILILSVCAPAQSYTLTFDGDLAGHYPDSASSYGALFDGSFIVADHSDSMWGPPHSGNNVLISSGYFGSGMLKFRTSPTGSEPYYVYSLSAYFSTQPGAIIKIVGCHDTHDQAIASALIGAPDEAWNNQYVEIDDPLGRINYFMFYPVSSSGALSQWSADNMTIVSVPEPSSIVALSFGLIPMGIAAVRLRRIR